MRTADLAKLLLGSSLVYGVFTACAASPKGPAASPRSPVPDALADGHKSGSRLKLRFYDGADGSRQFIGFWDTKLDVPCTVDERTQTTDGKIRCVPPESHGQVVYADGACATPLGIVVAKEEAQPKLRVHRNDAGVGYVLTSLGGPVAPPAKVYASFRGHSCVEQPIPADRVLVYPLGAELPPATLVEMTIKTE